VEQRHPDQDLNRELQSLREQTSALGASPDFVDRVMVALQRASAERWLALRAIALGSIGPLAVLVLVAWLWAGASPSLPSVAYAATAASLGGWW
jgi:hypothetical protein